MPRPCPFLACRFHLAAEQTGPAAAGAPSCTLDVADLGGSTLEEVGRILGVARERVRQIEKPGIRDLATPMRFAGLLTADEAAAAPEGPSAGCSAQG